MKTGPDLLIDLHNDWIQSVPYVVVEAADDDQDDQADEKGGARGSEGGVGDGDQRLKSDADQLEGRGVLDLLAQNCGRDRGKHDEGIWRVVDTGLIHESDACRTRVRTLLYSAQHDSRRGALRACKDPGISQQLV